MLPLWSTSQCFLQVALDRTNRDLSSTYSLEQVTAMYKPSRDEEGEQTDVAISVFFLRFLAVFRLNLLLTDTSLVAIPCLLHITSSSHAEFLIPPKFMKDQVNCFKGENHSANHCSHPFSSKALFISKSIAAFLVFCTPGKRWKKKYEN